MVKSLVTIFNTQAISPSSDFFPLPHTEKETPDDEWYAPLVVDS